MCRDAGSNGCTLDPTSGPWSKGVVQMIILRTVQNLSTSADVVLSIGIPEKDAVDWKCEYRVQGLSDQPSEVQFAMGVDGWQAMALAMEAMRAMLFKSADELQMYGHRIEGFFPRLEPMGVGPEFLAYIQKLIDDEVKRAYSEPGFLASLRNAGDDEA